MTSDNHVTGPVSDELVDRVVQYAREYEAAVRFDGVFVGNMEARLNDAVARLKASLRCYSKHKFWGAGEPDCPREIKAGNGELHTLRCKVCGQDDPRDDRCLAMKSAEQASVRYPDEAMMRQAFMEGWSAATDDDGTPYPDEAWEHSESRAALQYPAKEMGSEQAA